VITELLEDEAQALGEGIILRRRSLLGLELDLRQLGLLS